MRLTATIRACLAAVFLLAIAGCGATSTPAKPGQSSVGGLHSPTVTMFSHGLPSGGDLSSLVVGLDGNLWFTDSPFSASASPSIGRITPTGVITLFTHGLSPSGYTGGLASAPGGNLWFASGPDSPGGSWAIEQITPEGAITVIDLLPPGVALAPIGPPSLVESGASVWFMESPLGSGKPSIGRITP